MSNSIFNYDDSDYIYPISNNTGLDSDGNFYMRIGNNMSINMDTGEMNFTSNWSDDDDDDF